jgi:2-dehydro-3-deoxyphosphooctonate aldolase (KDO 8-P synthase)
MIREVAIGGRIRIGSGHPLVLIAGPCVLESEALSSEVAAFLADLSHRLALPVIFKGSFDKANRSSAGSYRGPGEDEGLRTLATVKERFNLPVTTDVHEAAQAQRVAEIADLLQIPAFLCRQTDLLAAAGKTGRPVNIKKGQFMAPLDMRHALAKVRESGNDRVILTERGASFGYHNLVVDMRAFPQLRSLGAPVVFDVTHSLQLPGAGDGVTAGQAEYIGTLACAGVAAGVDGVFLEMHERPETAKSDAQNALRLDLLAPLLRKLVRLHAVASGSDLPAPVPAS